MEGRPPQEASLIRRAAQKDTDAYAELVRNYSELAFRTAYLLTGNAEDAEDAAQEAFLKAYRALARFRQDLPFRPWLLRIVANEAHNSRRRQGRQERIELRLQERTSEGDAAPSPEEAVVAAEERAKLLRALNSLPETDRLVLSLRYLLGLSSEETAAVMRSPAGTVKSRQSRALDRLRAALGAGDV